MMVNVAFAFSCGSLLSFTLTLRGEVVAVNDGVPEASRPSTSPTSLSSRTSR